MAKKKRSTPKRNAPQDAPKIELKKLMMKLIMASSHKSGGRAVYRFNHDHWNYDQVFAEMNHYEFGSGVGHGKQNDFVQNYWKEFQIKAS